MLTNSTWPFSWKADVSDWTDNLSRVVHQLSGGNDASPRGPQLRSGESVPASRAGVSVENRQQSVRQLPRVILNLWEVSTLKCWSIRAWRNNFSELQRFSRSGRYQVQNSRARGHQIFDSNSTNISRLESEGLLEALSPESGEPVECAVLGCLCGALTTGRQERRFFQTTY